MEKITDISKWKSWEEEIFKELGVGRFDPTSSDIYDLMKVINSKKYAISVDTTLTHLCAAMKKKVYVMLPLFPDERWYKFRKITTCIQETAYLYSKKTMENGKKN